MNAVSDPQTMKRIKPRHWCGVLFATLISYMTLGSLAIVPSLVWLLASALLFACGEFLSKKFALQPSWSLVLMTVSAYVIGVLLWLPAILQKNQLSVTGTIWSVLSMLSTVFIGLLLFHEKLSLTGFIEIGRAHV